MLFKAFSQQIVNFIPTIPLIMSTVVIPNIIIQSDLKTPLSEKLSFSLDKVKRKFRDKYCKVCVPC